jgi:hypothetical protein
MSIRVVFICCFVVVNVRSATLCNAFVVLRLSADANLTFDHCAITLVSLYGLGARDAGDVAAADFNEATGGNGEGK